MRVSFSATALVWMLGVALLPKIGQSDPAPDKPAPTAAAPKAGEKLRLAFVTNNVSDYWTIARVGVRRAERELGVSVRFVMPPTGTVADQERILADLLPAADGIAISPVDPVNQTPDLNRAAAKTLLFTQDSDAPLSKRACFIGTDNVAAGREAGEQLKRVVPWGGEVMVFVGQAEAPNAAERIRGLRAALQNSNLRVLGVRVDDTDRVQAKSNVTDALMKHPHLAACVGIWSYNGPAILSAVKDAQKLGKVKIVGFDDEKDTLDAIERGQISATIVQQPEQFGYLSIFAMAKVLSGDKTAIPTNRRIMVPTLVLSQSNVGAYRRNLNQMLSEASQDGPSP